MKVTKCKRILAMLLCMLMVFSNLQIVTATEEQSKTVATASGSFVLAVATARKTIIEPVNVNYTAGQTIEDALKDSGYQFDGLGEGFITAIEGESGNFSIFCSDGEYELKRSPEGITVVAFLEGELYSENMVKLIARMGEYNAMTNNVQKYEKASDAYKNATDGLGYADNAKAGELLEALNAAITEYENIFKGTRYDIKVNVKQNGVEYANPVLTFTDIYGNDTNVTGNTVSLIAGEYTFYVSDGGYNRTEGTVTVTANAELNVNIPYGEWFGDVKILRNTKDASGNKIPYDYSQNKETHQAEYFIDDTAGATGTTYLNVQRGADIPDKTGTKLRVIYVGVNGKDQSTITKSWESQNNALVQALVPGMEGRTFPLEAWYTGTDGYKMIQSYDITLTRVPTASDIELKDENGTSLLSGFDPAVTEYAFNVINDYIIVDATPFGEEGYSIDVKADAASGSTIALKDGENKFSVVVSHTNGQQRSYNFTVTKVAPATVTMTTSSGVSVEVQNVNENTIMPKEGNVYELVPGESYTYIGTAQENYHSMATFTATDNATVTVATPEIKTVLTDFAMYDNSSSRTRKELTGDKDFSSSVYDYNLILSDANSSVFAQATVATGYTATARYERLNRTNATPYGGLYEKKITSVVNASKSATILNYAVVKSAYGNEITIRVWKKSGSTTYYQDYVIDLTRSLHLTSMEVSTAMGDVTFVDANNQKLDFDRDVLEYNMVVSAETTELNVAAHFMDETDTNALCGGYYAMTDGTRYEDLSNLVFSLDTSKETETKEIVVCHKNETAISNTYKLNIKKQKPVEVTFNIKPENTEAIVFVVNQIDQKPLFAQDGVFKMMPGVPYTYTITANGYVSMQVTDFAVAEGDPVAVDIQLTEAAKNENLQDLEAQWPSFRDENNNGVVDAKTPVVAEEGVLYWSNKVGDGYSGGATGCPILVDGYLYVYASNKIVKVDAISGETVATGDMIASSSFAINNPTYGGGMIFVGLSSGRIQAFDAVTLESLWVYKDAMGGQPNCQITYKDGYIYTGFWNGETASANYVCVSVTDEDPTQTQEAKTASWTHKQLGGFYWAGAYVSDDFMLVGTDDGESGYRNGYAHVLSIHPKTGEILGDIQLPHVGDLRSNITYDEHETGDYYFTNKGGYLYGISVNEDGTFKEDSLKYVKLPNGTTTQSMSTSTPTIYNGRAYVGVSGAGQFSAYSGHNIAVVDLERMKVAYSVPTQGYPQTSGVLTTAYEKETGKVYVYFFDNYTPGKLRCFSDMPGQNKLMDVTTETVGSNVYATGYVLFTPSGSEAQYAICSPIVDENGVIYFKNDSARLMAFGPTIEKIEVTKMPDTTEYTVGKAFNPKGMEVVATYSNGTTRDITDYVSYSTSGLTELDTEFEIRFEHVKYQNVNGVSGQEYHAPTAVIDLTIYVSDTYVMEKIDAIGEVTLEKEEAIVRAREAYNLLPDFAQELVTNYQTLLDAEEALAGLKVPDLIARIDAIGEVTIEKQVIIEEVKASYDSLSEENKTKVTNYNILEAAVKKLNELLEEVKDREAAAEIEAQIAAIGEVTLEKELTITEVRKNYDALTDNAKKKVTNVSVLEAAESALAQLKKAEEEAKANAESIAAVIAAIAAIGEVTLEKEAAIVSARTAYDALSDTLKVNIINYDVLTTAEESLKELKADIAAATAVEAQIASIGEVTLDKKAAINEARVAYDALSENAKNRVSNYGQLEAAEATLKLLEQEAVKPTETPIPSETPGPSETPVPSETTTPSETPTPKTYGDVNLNGEVTAGDALLVLKAVVKLETLTEEQISQADVDVNGKVDATDALNILKYVVKLIQEFPVIEKL